MGRLLLNGDEEEWVKRRGARKRKETREKRGGNSKRQVPLEKEKTKTFLMNFLYLINNPIKSLDTSKNLILYH